jgi:hypothetical protein
MFLLAFDSIGFLLSLSKTKFNSKLSHIGHLSGNLFGIWYFNFGHKYLWESKREIISLWHEIRSKKE